VADFDRAIPPGGEGKITLAVRTKGYQGEIQKSARVYTNDPHHSTLELGIVAIVTVPIHIYPKYVYLQGETGHLITRTVVITAEKNDSLRLVPNYFNLDKQIDYKIEEADAGKVFRIHFTSIPKAAGNYKGILKLKTNYPDKPEIDIPITARFREQKNEVKKSTTQ